MLMSNLTKEQIVQILENEYKRASRICSDDYSEEIYGRDKFAPFHVVAKREEYGSIIYFLAEHFFNGPHGALAQKLQKLSAEELLRHLKKLVENRFGPDEFEWIDFSEEFRQLLA